MIRKLTFAVGVGAGYVLGAKAGRERYELIMTKARELAGKPAVQDFTSNVSQTASTVADKAKGSVNEKVSAVSGKSSGSSTPDTDLGTSTADADLIDLGPEVVTGSPTPVVTTTPMPTTPLPPTTMPGAASSVTTPDTF